MSRFEVRGAKGASAPYEASDTLRSTQTAEVVDLLGEGQIGGLVNGLKSVYLDGVPVQNADDSLNFPEFAYQITLGGPTSEAAHEFGDVQTEVGVGVTVLAAVPVVRTIADATADAVRVTLTVPQLVQQLENGDRVGTTFEFAIDIQSNGGGYVERWADTVSGKASSPYSRAIRLSLTEVGPPPWDVRVRRVTADSASANLVNAFAWASYTVISGVRMLYRNSPTARLVFDARSFSSIPQVWYDVWGFNDWDIPVNYDPLARTVSGSWNGLWKQGPTNNPAWVVHNLVKHPRYGLGQYVVQLPDKWTLYQLALWCDVMLPDGRGGTEPRYSINAWIIEQSEALRLLQEICSVFRGVLMHGGSGLTVTWDAPGEPVASYAPANVVDGTFTYSDGSSAAKKTSCTCWYTDRRQAAKRESVTWDDGDLVARYGLRNFEINPIGVATAGQALRMAKWALYTAHYEEQSVAFRVGAEGATRRLGEVFQVTDPSETGERLGGRIHAATTTEVDLDAPVTLASGEIYTLWVTQPHASEVDRLVLEGRTVTTAAGTVDTLTVSPAFSAAPLAQTVWLLEGSDVEPTLWKYVQIVEVQGQDGQPEFDVLGVRHEPGKFDLVEYDQPLTQLPTRRLGFGVPPVASVDILETSYYDDQDQLHISASVSWPIPAPGLRYVLSWRLKKRSWNTLPPTSSNTVEGTDLEAGEYEVQVQSLNGLGQLSTPTFASAELLGDARLPPDVAGMGWAIKPGQAVVYWDRWIDPLYLEHELRLGDTWDAAEFLWAGVATDFKYPRPPNGTYKVLAKIRSKGGRYSANAVFVNVVVDDSIDSYGVGLLRLKTDRFPVFTFADGTTHTSASPDLTITALLFSLVGTATFTAVAYDVDEMEIGPVTLSGSGNVRTMSAAQFVAPGVSGSVQRVRVTGVLTLANDYVDVYRDDPTIVGPRMYLSNPAASVPTDEAGSYGDYSDAVTLAVLYDTGADITAAPAWTWSIAADAGVTATINEGSGPVSEAATITVAVSDMTIDDGVVLVSATDGVVTKTKPFRVTKRKATAGGFQLYFEPRSELVLPLRADGTVASLAEAWTNARVKMASGLDVTALWSYSKEDIGVTSELVGNRVQITGFLPLGTLGDVVSSPINAPDDWQRAASATWCEIVWVVFGYHASAEYSHVLRSATFETFSQVDMGTDGHWTRGAYGAGQLMAIETGVIGTDRVMRSSDKGITWVLKHLSQSGEWAHVHFGDAFLFARADAASGSRTFNGEDFEDLTLPDSGCAPSYSAGTWAAVTPAGDLHVSADSGDTWSAAKNADMGLPPGMVVSRAVGFIGAIVAALDGPTNLVIASIDGGATWFKLALPGEYSNPRMLQIIKGVLYLVSADLAVYCTADGLHWFASSEPFGGSAGIQDAIYGAADSIDVDYIPDLDTGTADEAPAGAVVLLLQGGSLGGTTMVDRSSYGGSAAISDYAAWDDEHQVFALNTLKCTTVLAAGEAFSEVGHHSASRFGRASGDKHTIEIGVFYELLLNYSISTMLWQWRSAGGRIIELTTYSTGQLQIRHGDDGSLQIATLTANVQHWVQVNFDGTAVSVDLDGVEVYTGTNGYGIDGGVSTWSMSVGTLPGGNAAGPTTEAWVGPFRMTRGLLRDRGSVPTDIWPTDDTQHAQKQQLAATSADTGFVKLNASKDGQLPLSGVVPVRLATPRRPLYTARVTPPWLALPSTSDGVVTDFSKAVFTAGIDGDGTPDTPAWAIRWTTVNLTPSSGTGPVAVITGMDVGQDHGSVYFVGEKAGEKLVEGSVDVVKDKSGTSSGPLPGVVYHRIAVGNTFASFRFNPEGTWELKRGSSGSYVVQGQWAGAVRPENAAYYMRMQNIGGDPFTSGSVDVFLSMAVPREFEFENLTSGVHVCQFAITFATDAGGSDAAVAFGSLQLEVP
jgi:hypothetical protein